MRPTVIAVFPIGNSLKWFDFKKNNCIKYLQV
jgi:hypothetical protein